MNLTALRSQFPALQAPAFLDWAATAPRPQCVVEAMAQAESSVSGSARRGIHRGAQSAATHIEGARATVARYLGVPAAHLVWTSGATAALNLAAHGWAHHLRPGDLIWVSPLEHHANLLPWQRVAAQTGATLQWLPLDAALRVDVAALAQAIGPSTRVIACTHVSNVTGALQPIAALCELARQHNILTVIDGAQGILTFPDLSLLGADIYAFSGHKLGSPAGVGALVARPDILAQLAPLLVGGGIVDDVGLTTASFLTSPRHLETGTLPVGGLVGLATAFAWHHGQHGGPQVGEARAHKQRLRDLLVDGLRNEPGVRLIAEPDVPLVSFTVDGAHPHDLGTLLDEDGVAVRVGHHCARPLHDRLGIGASVRASAGVVTQETELAHFFASLRAARTLLCG